MTPKEVLEFLIPLKPPNIRTPLLAILESIDDNLCLKVPIKFNEVLSIFNAPESEAIKVLFDECEKLAPRMIKRAS